MQKTKLDLKSKIQIWVIKDKTTGAIWSTPKGKCSWSGRGQAKNAWMYQHGSAGRSFDTSEHNLEAVCVAEYVLL